MEWTLRPKAQRHALQGGLRALQRSYSLILFVVAWELVMEDPDIAYPVSAYPVPERRRKRP